MPQEESKQKLANLIQCYEQAVSIAKSLSNDGSMIFIAFDVITSAQIMATTIKRSLQQNFALDYDGSDAPMEVIKEGSTVEVLVNHMPGMKGGTATIKSYSLPANLSDITMPDGMMMNNHKWLTNDEVKLTAKKM
jgi:hypothetical protein